ERARYATNLLKHGISILDAVHDAGYFDQPHLTRSVGHLIGQTPARIVGGDEQLSFLYKTTPPEPPMMQDRASHHDDFATRKDHLGGEGSGRVGGPVPAVRLGSKAAAAACRDGRDDATGVSRER